MDPAALQMYRRPQLNQDTDAYSLIF